MPSLRHPSTALALVLLAASSFTFAQDRPVSPDARAPGAAPLPRPGPAGPSSLSPRPSPPLAARDAQTVITGRVARLLPNPNGDVDGLLLEDGTQVSMPPHLSTRLMEAVKPRDEVAVNGWRAPNAATIRAVEIRNTASGKTVADNGPDGTPPPPREPSALTSMQASGRIATLLHTDRGDVNGVVLDNGTSVRFPPHVGLQFTGLLRTGGTLYAQGYGTRAGPGGAIEATRLGGSPEAQQAVFAPPRPDAPPRPEAPPALPIAR